MNSSLVSLTKSLTRTPAGKFQMSVAGHPQLRKAQVFEVPWTWRDQVQTAKCWEKFERSGRDEIIFCLALEGVGGGGSGHVDG